MLDAHLPVESDATKRTRLPLRDVVRVDQVRPDLVYGLAMSTASTMLTRDLTLASAPCAFEHVLVVGAGQMGGGIAQVVAASGRRVSLHDAAPGAVERGLETMRKSLEQARREGRAATRRRCSGASSRSTTSCPPT